MKTFLYAAVVFGYLHNAFAATPEALKAKIKQGRAALKLAMDDLVKAQCVSGGELKYRSPISEISKVVAGIGEFQDPDVRRALHITDMHVALDVTDEDVTLEPVDFYSWSLNALGKDGSSDSGDFVNRRFPTWSPLNDNNLNEDDVTGDNALNIKKTEGIYDALEQVVEELHEGSESFQVSVVAPVPGRYPPARMKGYPLKDEQGKYHLLTLSMDIL